MFKKNPSQKRAGGVAQMVRVPMSSNPSAAKKKKKKSRLKDFHYLSP
jgi:hypothetical protein